MPTEESVIKSEEIKSFIALFYGINLSEVRTVSHGSANCYCLSEGSISNFLKEFQNRFCGSDLEREVKLVKYLIKKEFPQQRYLRL